MSRRRDREGTAREGTARDDTTRDGTQDNFSTQIFRVAQTTSQWGREVLDKPQSKSFLRNYLPFTVFMIVVLFFLLSLLHQRLRSYQLGFKITELEKERKVLQEELDELRIEMIEKMSPKYLQAKQQEFQIKVVPPEEWLPKDNK